MSPVVQISKIQVRSGDKEDLPQGLESSEIGFSENTGELFIGADTSKLPAANRTKFPFNNVQILTELSKNSEDLINYYPQMRDFANFDDFNKPLARFNPIDSNDETISRNLQERLDERVSVLAYGAKGNGTLDININNTFSAEDATKEAYAINLAALDVAINMNSINVIDDYHPKSLYFPAGVYVINQKLLLPPNSSWLGDGIGNTIIYLIDSTIETILCTTDGGIQVSDLPFASSPGGGTGATASASFTSGAISSITVDDAGTGYKSPLITISGNGTGATASATVNSNGAITAITVDNGGTGYTTATVIVKDRYGTTSDHTYLNINANNGLPDNVKIQGIEFRRIGNKDVLHLMKCRNSKFIDCKISGDFTANSQPTTYTYNQSGTASSVVDSVGLLIDNMGSSIECENIITTRCEIENVTYGAILTSDMNNITFSSNIFSNMLRGISIAETLPDAKSKGRLTNGIIGPRRIKALHNRFHNIAQEGFRVWPKSLVTATATATQVGGAISSIIIVEQGTGYNAPPTITISDAGAGPDVAANAQAVLDEYGRLDSINLISNGSGYTSPIVTIQAPPTTASPNDNLENRYGQNISFMNVYDQVGNDLDGSGNPGSTSITPVVSFGEGAFYNMSMGDMFSRNTSVGLPRVVNDINGNNLILNAQDPANFGNNFIIPGLYKTNIIESNLVLSNSAASMNARVLIPVSEVDNATVRYSLIEKSPGTKKATGVFNIITDGTNVSFEDSRTDLTSSSVLNVYLQASVVTISSVVYVEITYTSGNTNDVTFKYQVEGWKT